MIKAAITATALTAFAATAAVAGPAKPQPNADIDRDRDDVIPRGFDPLAFLERSDLGRLSPG